MLTLLHVGLIRLVGHKCTECNRAANFAVVENGAQQRHLLGSQTPGSVWNVQNMQRKVPRF